MNRKKFKVTLISVLIIALLLLITGTILINWDDSEDEYNASGGSNDEIRVAAVGDSITYGYGLSFMEDSYPEELSELLGDNYRVENFGVNNHAAMKSSDYPYPDTEEYQESLDFNPDIALIMLGTNDSKNTNWNGNEQFREEYEELIDTYADNNPETEIYLMTPPKAFNEPQYEGDINNENVNEIVQITEEVADERGYEVIDINQLSRGNSEWFEDTIHPNGDGTESIAEEVYKHLSD